MNKLYSEFAVVTRIKFPFFPWPNLIFYKPYVTSRNGPLMHNTTAYTSHIQNRNTWVIVDYHNELWENSKSSYTFVWATEKNVQELLSKSVHRNKYQPRIIRKALLKCNEDTLYFTHYTPLWPPVVPGGVETDIFEECWNLHWWIKPETTFPLNKNASHFRRHVKTY